MTTFSLINIELWHILARFGSVLSFDTCKFNRDIFGAECQHDSVECER